MPYIIESFAAATYVVIPNIKFQREEFKKVRKYMNCVDVTALQQTRCVYGDFVIQKHDYYCRVTLTDLNIKNLIIITQEFAMPSI
jgi:hypothetical protein